MGKNRNAVRLSVVTENGFPMEALWFGDGDGFEKELSGHSVMDAIYYPGINEYNGSRSIQIVIKNYKLR